ncbi:MAG: hypothetical protein NZM05_12075 [Chloroherpetonaceae bacterium]|nr:hypothetical protein [Chloroherpetonaceae bacterium]
MPVFCIVSDVKAETFFHSCKYVLLLLSLVVIFVELLFGTMMILNFYLRAAALCAASLLAFFTSLLALQFALSDATSLTCGCFGRLWIEPAGVWSVAKNILLLFCCLVIYLASTQSQSKYESMGDTI